MNEHIVEYEKYCLSCKRLNDDEDDPLSPCWECLDTPTNMDSKKPINYKSTDE